MTETSKKRRIWPVLYVYGTLLLLGMLVLLAGLIRRDFTVIALGVLILTVPSALLPIALALRVGNGTDGKQPVAEVLRLMETIESKLSMSDAARRAAFRTQDLEILRHAIGEDIERAEFDQAMMLVGMLSQNFGLRQEAEEFREAIEKARAADQERRIDMELAKFGRLLDAAMWDQAMTDAAKIQRLFPESPRVRGLERRLHEAKDQRKHELERQFLEAAEKDDVERAVELLQDLDKYLSEQEAEPFRETARGVIGKKRDNLGVQFKLSVHDKDWTAAVRVGEQIIREFPNSKMAHEVRGMLDVLRERATSQRAAQMT